MNKQFASISLLAACLAVSGCSHKGTKATLDTNPTAAHDTTGDAARAKGDTRDQGKASTDKGGNFIWQDVYFSYDDASLGEDARKTLSETGNHLSKHPEHVEVQGNCDERGSVEYNLALGERRAHSVKDYLVSYGIPEKSLSTVSFGKEKPLSPGHDESAWSQNRRVHFATGDNQ